MAVVDSSLFYARMYALGICLHHQSLKKRKKPQNSASWAMKPDFNNFVVTRLIDELEYYLPISRERGTGLRLV